TNKITGRRAAIFSRSESNALPKSSASELSVMPEGILRAAVSSLTQRRTVSFSDLDRMLAPAAWASTKDSPALRRRLISPKRAILPAPGSPVMHKHHGLL